VTGPAPIPPLTVAVVDAARMKTMAALLRDPYPIHWDVDAVRAAGHGDRPVNQGPLNLAYVANMLMAWAGEGSIRRLSVSFHARVFAGDTVVASGEVDAITADAGGERRARCTVRLTRGDDLIVSGTADVAL
jgi:acyl dehydratase